MTDAVRARLNAAFDTNLEARGEIGAAVSVWEDGEEVFSRCGGVTARGGDTAWSVETLVPVYSATKGMAAATVLVVLEREGFDLQRRVVEVWPGFAGGGKREVSLGQLLSHQAGVAALDEVVEIDDHEAVVGAIERQVPNWEIGTGHGYHARTFGALLEELVRRLCGGARLGEVWREIAGEPLGLDVWIGLPEAEWGRVATLSAPREMRDDAFTRAYLEAGSLTRRAFESPRGFSGATAMNRPEAWALGHPAMGGVASARGLGRFYGVLAGGGGGVFSERVLGWLQGVLSEGDDRVLKARTGFTAGMLRGSAWGCGDASVGHPGAGGSLGWFETATRRGFGYVMNQLGAGALPGDRPRALVGALGG